MAELDALEEMRAMNQRHAGLMKGGGEGSAAYSVKIFIMYLIPAGLGEIDLVVCATRDATTGTRGE